MSVCYVGERNKVMQLRQGPSDGSTCGSFSLTSKAGELEDLVILVISW